MTTLDTNAIVANVSRARRRAPLAADWRTYLFMGYNIALMVISGVALILLLVRSAYPPSSAVAKFWGEQTAADQSGEGATSNDAGAPAAEANSEAAKTVLFYTLVTVLTAGCAGGVLCNLRGIFKYYRDEGGFPARLVWPFVVRPAMGAAVGLFVFFIASFFSEALSAGAADTASFAWTSLKGRIPLVGLAILAGFGSQEFMERMKEVAKATFAVSGQDADQIAIQEIASWSTNDKPELAPPGANELILLYSTEPAGQRIGPRIIKPDDTVGAPTGAGKALRITGGTPLERQSVAEQLKQLVS